MTKLTPKQEVFVQEYLVDLNATQAAIRAGYSKKTAHRTGNENMQKPAIKAAIDEAKLARSERTEIDQDYVLKQAVKLHERCMQDISPVMVKDGKDWVHATGEDAEGNEGYLYQFNAAGAAKALELVGRHVKVQSFADKQIHEHTGTIEHSHSERQIRLDALKEKARRNAVH